MRDGALTTLSRDASRIESCDVYRPRSRCFDIRWGVAVACRTDVSFFNPRGDAWSMLWRGGELRVRSRREDRLRAAMQCCSCSTIVKRAQSSFHFKEIRNSVCTFVKVDLGQHDVLVNREMRWHESSNQLLRLRCAACQMSVDGRSSNERRNARREVLVLCCMRTNAKTIFHFPSLMSIVTRHSSPPACPLFSLLSSTSCFVRSRLGLLVNVLHQLVHNHPISNS